MGNPILILGAGSWGSALALTLARNERRVYLWDVDSDHIATLRKEGGNNRHLPGFPFPDIVTPIDHMLPLPAGVEDIIVVVPCESLRSVIGHLREAGTGHLRICLASKGLEPDTLLLNHQVVAEVLGDVPVAILSGPSFAAEVAACLPTAVVIASTDPDTAWHFAESFHNDMFRIYTGDDVIGVQVGGAVKNIMAIAAGISDGLGFGANTRSALITRGLAEIIRLGTAMGGRQETFMGLTGLGDLVLSCTDDQSRNRRFGLALARGKSEQQARSEIGQVIEGIRTAAVVIELARSHGVEMPISEHVYKVIKGEMTAREAVQSLLTRDRKAETVD
jgi:glycerol-3-phosphate dehydrogenase (NAD(P)+)